MDERIHCVVEDYQAGPNGTIRGTVRIVNPELDPTLSAPLSSDRSAKMGSMGYVAIVANPIDPACHAYEIVTGAETTAPADEPRPNHVRDAVRANQ